ncbi:hypothetical protein NLI96_g8364 [Meripilus lineatus]|uniref:Alkaline ceramidase n=1 Tax=Meripilus lineatus TaxID=2056292 RepID=A0AAD5V2N4_9APHY|nr:hypothetical protein NLI96_g8364 [Physisporinus lineatus]
MGTLAVAFNDTLVVFAISTRLLMDSLATTWKLRLRALRKGKGMGQVSRILLRTGQQYYIATIGINLCAAVVILTPSIPPTIRELMYYPNVAIVNIMACRAFRQLRVEMMKGCVTSFTVDLGGIGGQNSPSGLKVSDLEWANPSNEQNGSTTNEGRPGRTEGLRHTREIGQLNYRERTVLPCWKSPDSLYLRLKRLGGLESERSLELKRLIILDMKLISLTEESGILQDEFIPSIMIPVDLELRSLYKRSSVIGFGVGEHQKKTKMIIVLRALGAGAAVPQRPRYEGANWNQLTAHLFDSTTSSVQSQGGLTGVERGEATRVGQTWDVLIKSAAAEWKMLTKPRILVLMCLHEAANTVSNLVTIILAIWGAQQARSASLPSRYFAGYTGFALVGLGSMIFHATLLYEAQLADELPMIYVASYCGAILLDTQKGFSLRNAKAASLTALFFAFNILFTWTYSGAGIFALGFFVWNLDNIFCKTITRWKIAIGWPAAFLLELHSWWHVLTVGISFPACAPSADIPLRPAKAIGTYLMLVGNTYLYAAFRSDPPVFNKPGFLGPCVSRTFTPITE